MSEFHKPNHPAYDEAIQQWKAATTHKLRAVIEERLWAMASPSQRHAFYRREWLKAALSEPGTYYIQARSALLPAPEIVWEY